MSQGSWPQPGWPGGSQQRWPAQRQVRHRVASHGWQYPPHAWQQARPPQPPPRRSGLSSCLAVLAGLGGGACLVLLLGLVLQGKMADTVSPPTASNTVSTATTEPNQPRVNRSATPSVPGINPGLPEREWPQLPSPNSTNPHWVRLQQNELYPIGLPELTDCPEADFAHSLAELEEQATAQLTCVQEAWVPVLRAAGFSAAKIPVYFYSGSSVETPCGTYQAPALYCSAQGGAIYFGEDILIGASQHAYGVKEVVGHEYGHHLQALGGMFHAQYVADNSNEGARRLELQATCWGYAMIAHDESVAMNQQVFDTFEPYLRLTIEDGIHGSHESLAYWGIRGLYSTTLGNCNTWTAESADVD